MTQKVNGIQNVQKANSYQSRKQEVRMAISPASDTQFTQTAGQITNKLDYRICKVKLDHLLCGPRRIVILEEDI